MCFIQRHLYILCDCVIKDNIKATVRSDHIRF